MRGRDEDQHGEDDHAQGQFKLPVGRAERVGHREDERANHRGQNVPLDEEPQADQGEEDDQADGQRAGQSTGMSGYPLAGSEGGRQSGCVPHLGLNQVVPQRAEGPDQRAGGGADQDMGAHLGILPAAGHDPVPGHQGMRPVGAHARLQCQNQQPQQRRGQHPLRGAGPQHDGDRAIGYGMHRPQPDYHAEEEPEDGQANGALAIHPVPLPVAPRQNRGCNHAE